MPFGVVSGAGRGMGVLDRDGDRRRGKGSFGGKCGASYCNQWGTLWLCILCREGWLRASSQITLGFLVKLSNSPSLFALESPIQHSICVEWRREARTTYLEDEKLDVDGRVVSNIMMDG